MIHTGHRASTWFEPSFPIVRLTRGAVKKLQAPPAVSPRFFKAHGQGNDYLVVEDGPGPVLSEALVRRICDRHRGPGADGLVVVERSGDGRAGPAPGRRDGVGGLPPTRLRMFNPDGSEFERSGNGLRIVGVYLDRRLDARGARLPVIVGGDQLWVRVLGSDGQGTHDVELDMGLVAVPASPRGASVTLALPGPHGAAEDENVRVVPVSLGNPHAVAFRESWTDADVDHYGPLICSHEAFPHGTNVQFAEIPEGSVVSIRIWERGVGRTLSSGTSACAAVAAAVRSGMMDPGPATVVMEGGDMRVSLASDWTARLRGPVQEVCSGELAPGVLSEAR